MTTQPNASDVEKATKIVEMVMQHMDELSSCVREISEALSSVRLEERKRYERLVEAAKRIDGSAQHDTVTNMATMIERHAEDCAKCELFNAINNLDSTDVDSSEGKGVTE